MDSSAKAREWVFVPERTARKISRGNGEYGHTECSECGETVHRRDRFCWSCGARFEVGE